MEWLCLPDACCYFLGFLYGFFSTVCIDFMTWMANAHITAAEVAEGSQDFKDMLVLQLPLHFSDSWHRDVSLTHCKPAGFCHRNGVRGPFQFEQGPHLIAKAAAARAESGATSQPGQDQIII